MRLRNLLRCSKPLIFEDGIPDFEYSIGGSCFLAKFRGQFYAITAEHCIKSRDANCVRIMYDELDTSKEPFLPFHRIGRPVHPPDDPQDYRDLVMFAILSESLTDDQRRSDWFLDFDHFTQDNLILQEGDTLATRGFPHEINGIDYDRRVISTRAFAVDGSYGGPMSDDFIHKFKFSDLSQIEDINGISGSPVFVLRPGEPLNIYSFAGMIIRGSTLSGFSRFIDRKALFVALKEASG